MSAKLKINNIFHMSYGSTMFTTEEITPELDEKITDFSKAILICEDENISDHKGLSGLEILSQGLVLVHRYPGSPKYGSYQTR